MKTPDWLGVFSFCYNDYCMTRQWNFRKLRAQRRKKSSLSDIIVNVYGRKMERQKPWSAFYQKKRSKSVWSKLALSKIKYSPIMIVAWLSLFSILSYALFFSDLFLVQNLEISGNHFVETEAVRKEILPEGRRLNWLLFGAGRLNDQLKSAFSEIDEVSFERIWPSTLRVTIAEQDTPIIWETNNQQFLITREGYVYDVMRPGVVALIVKDDKNLPVKVGERISTEDFVNFVTRLASNLPRKTGLTVQQVRVPETTFEIEVETNQSYYLIFDTGLSLDRQLDNLARSLNYLEDNTVYVDLRVPDRVFYK